MSAAFKPSELALVAVRRADQLRQMSFAEISAMPDRQDESAKLHEQKVSVAVWRDTLADGSIRVVVQAYHCGLLGVGSMASDGFIIASDGTFAAVPQEMMWEFT